MKKKKFKVLMELRTCFEGFAGIPQETRLEFCSLNALDNIEMTGLINHQSRHLRSRRTKPTRRPRPLTEFNRILNISRLALSTKSDPFETAFEKVLRIVDKYIGSKLTEFGSILGREIKVRDFDASHFGDFIWQTLFAKSLPPTDFEAMRTARFASIRPPWRLLNSIAGKPMRGMTVSPPPKMNTRSYDAFISQTPWPTLLHNNTETIVRYHDSVPVFLPHTIPQSGELQMAHMAALRLNQRKGIFVCVSEAARKDLLVLMPHLEKRSVVVPNMVSSEYFEEVGNDKYVSSIIRNNICADTEPKFLTTREKERFYATHLGGGKPVRFLLMVSTLEPRKNHSKLLAAWDYLVHHGHGDLKLVLVGSTGWEYDKIVRSLASPQEQGRLFHLERVPSGQLRVLYNAAEAVVCPSVYEGFDLTGIEAMLCGGALAASDIPVHREVYGDACEYFNPYSVLGQARALENIIAPEYKARREELVRTSLRHGSKYRGENIQPLWRDLFDRIAGKDFKK